MVSVGAAEMAGALNSRLGMAQLLEETRNLYRQQVPLLHWRTHWRTMPSWAAVGSLASSSRYPRQSALCFSRPVSFAWAMIQGCQTLTTAAQ